MSTSLQATVDLSPFSQYLKSNSGGVVIWEFPGGSLTPKFSLLMEYFCSFMFDKRYNQERGSWQELRVRLKTGINYTGI